MIVSQTSDAAWQASFRGLHAFVPPTGPVLVVAPHPDDETLGAGALIASLRQRGAAVTVVAATDGENAYDTCQQERDALRQIREVEQQDALAVLGVGKENIHRLRLTDSGLHTQEDVLTGRLMHLAEPGMTILAPWSGDFHPDHEACAHASAAVAAGKHLPLISYFFWTWHRGTPELLHGLNLRLFPVTAEAAERKAAALSKHRSQLKHSSEEPILPDRLLGPARWPFEVFLPA